MNNAYIFKVFDSPHLVAGQLDFGIARLPDGRYVLVFAKGNGMLASRRFSELNAAPPDGESAELSADGRPLIWFDAAIDRDPRNLGPAGGTLAALLAATPAVVRTTGRTRAGETPEVEILLTEDELARVCSSCGLVESKTEERRWQRHSGDGYRTMYWCEMCANSSLRRAWQWVSGTSS